MSSRCVLTLLPLQNQRGHTLIISKAFHRSRGCFTHPFKPASSYVRLKWRRLASLAQPYSGKVQEPRHNIYPAGIPDQNSPSSTTSIKAWPQQRPPVSNNWSRLLKWMGFSSWKTQLGVRKPRDLQGRTFPSRLLRDSSFVRSTPLVIR